MFRCGIHSYGCSSSAGPSVRDFWRDLRAGRDHARPVEGFSSSVCSWPDSPESPCHPSVLELLVHHAALAWKDCQTTVSGRLGLILASTKGCIDDWVWKESPDLSRDPLTPVLEGFLTATQLRPIETLCVSNACTSSLAALLLGREWLKQNRVDQVLIVAVDRAGPFVRKGFETLKAVTPTISRPFGKDRDGLCLGDAAAAILLSRTGGFAEIEAIATDTEGYAVTRPAQSGSSLRRACLALGGISERKPDLIVAHATGTPVNDQTEDEVFRGLFGENSVPVTATKWSIGHTLATSAAMDTIAACEVLRNQAAFRLANTQQLDPALGSRYLSAHEAMPEPFHAERVLVSSLGFGGVHAAALIKKSEARA